MTTLNQGPSVGMAPFLRCLGAMAWPSETAAGSDQPHDQQQHNGADRGIDDLRYQAGADMDAELRKQKTGDKRAGDTDETIPGDAKAGAAHDPAGQPAGDQADEQNHAQGFA